MFHLPHLINLCRINAATFAAARPVNLPPIAGYEVRFAKTSAVLILHEVILSLDYTPLFSPRSMPVSDL
jgi:hypothetical protein